LLRYASHAEFYSNHPIATSILNAYGKEVIKDAVTNYEEISGHGIMVTVEEKEILAGNYKLMDKEGIAFEQVETIGTVVHVAVDKKYMDKDGKFHLNKSGLVVYSNGEYYGLGELLGRFGYSVKKKK
jgi:hypothetical protein